MRMLLNLRQTYGDVVRFRLVKRECYLFARPDDIRYVLRSNSGNFRKAFLFDKIRVLLGNGLLPMPYEDEFWRRRRRLSQPAFHRGRLERYAHVWATATATFLERWDAQLGGGPLDAFLEMYALSYELAVRTLLSTDAGGAESAAVRAAFDVGLEHLKHKMGIRPTIRVADTPR